MSISSTDAAPAYGRVLLKLSGEALMGDLEYGTDPERVRAIAQEIATIHRRGVEVAIVVREGYKDMVNNLALARRFGAHLEALGRAPRETDPRVGAGPGRERTGLGRCGTPAPGVRSARRRRLQKSDRGWNRRRRLMERPG